MNVRSRGLYRAVALGAGLLAGALAGPAGAVGDLAGALSRQLEAQISDPAFGVSDQDFLALQAFYQARGFAPLWVDAAGALPRARALAGYLAEAAGLGLRPGDYGGRAIADVIDAGTPEDRVTLEYLLSAAVIGLGGDLKSGRVDPAKVDRELHIEPRGSDPMALLEGAAAAVAEDRDIVAYLESLGPQSPNYRRLKASLADYRAVAADGGWPAFPGGETLKPGMRDPRVAALRAQLAARGDLAAVDAPLASDDPELYDPVLEKAVKWFQYRHGLAQDGAVGKMTAAALNVPIETRIRQLELNMERRRWMLDDLGERYVFVNMADFYLKVVDGPKTIHVTEVVIGLPYHRTPVFSGEMTYLVLNPYWNVPPSIASKEILPKVKADPGYLARKNFKVFADWSGRGPALDPAGINWASVSQKGFRYKLRQDPGESNALGRVKFMFPNQFNVYLHDTPSRALFQRTVRSFSHGCIRVHKPIDFAEVILATDGDWPRKRIDEVLASKTRTIVKLKAPMQVHLTYLTAWANKDGSVHFRDDIYGRDKRLDAALKRSQAPLD